MRMCVCNMYKYLLLEFMYTMCVNVSCDYLFVYLLQVMGCSYCCVLLCPFFINACWDGLILSFITCMCSYLVFNSCNTSKFRVIDVSVCVIHEQSVFTDFYIYISNVFRCFPFFSVFTTFIALIMMCDG
jgi:hypothetical protein